MWQFLLSVVCVFGVAIAGRAHAVGGQDPGRSFQKLYGVLLDSASGRLPPFKILVIDTLVRAAPGPVGEATPLGPPGTVVDHLSLPSTVVLPHPFRGGAFAHRRVGGDTVLIGLFRLSPAPADSSVEFNLVLRSGCDFLQIRRYRAAFVGTRWVAQWRWESDHGEPNDPSDLARRVVENCP